MVFWGASLVGWWLFPYRVTDDQMMHQMRWLGHIVGEKIAGLLLLCVTAFLASRAHHPTGKWGIATGIGSGLAFQLIAVCAYVVQFGIAAYKEYNALFYTLIWTVLLAWAFGYLAVRRQYLQEKQAA